MGEFKIDAGSCQDGFGRLWMIRIVSGNRQGRRVSKIQGTAGGIVSLDMILSVLKIGSFNTGCEAQ